MLVDSVVVSLVVLKLLVEWLLEDALLVLEYPKEDDLVVLVVQATVSVEVAEVVIATEPTPVTLTRAKLYT